MILKFENVTDLGKSIECSVKTNNIQGHFGLNFIKKEFRIYLPGLLNPCLILQLDAEEF